MVITVYYDDCCIVQVTETICRRQPLFWQAKTRMQGFRPASPRAKARGAAAACIIQSLNKFFHFIISGGVRIEYVPGLYLNSFKQVGR